MRKHRPMTLARMAAIDRTWHKMRLREDLCSAADGLCEYCLRRVGMAGTIDHWLPRALGGGDERRNLRWCCLACNRVKADMHPDEWQRVQPQLRPIQPTRRDVRRMLLTMIAQRARAKDFA